MAISLGIVVAASLVCGALYGGVPRLRDRYAIRRSGRKAMKQQEVG
jgi:hypothetical protein